MYSVFRSYWATVDVQYLMVSITPVIKPSVFQRWFWQKGSISCPDYEIGLELTEGIFTYAFQASTDVPALHISVVWKNWGGMEG